MGMQYGNSMSACALRAWAMIKGGPIENEIRGLWRASAFLAGKDIFIEGNRMLYRPDGQGWEPIDHAAVAFVQTKLASTGKLNGKSIYIEFPDDEESVRDFLRVAIRTNATLEEAAATAEIRRLNAAPSSEWVPAMNLLQSADAGVIAHFLTAYRKEADEIASQLSMSHSRNLFENNRLILGGRLGEKIRRNGIDQVMVSFNGVPAGIFTGAKYRAAVRDGVDKSLRLLESRGILARGTEVGRNELDSGDIINATIEMNTFGWAQIVFRKV